jgi:lipopolysaccharide transport system ATP-binding protein
MKPIVEIKNIGKRYTITHQKGGYITLRDVLANIFNNPFSFLKSRSKQILGIETKEEFWALKDINFEINEGEVIGIIGRNGAGKSTLLKILSQITPPTTGEIKIRGTLGSLLEVGTGFHPELTGRENIFLNGAILGMKKSEIIRKFDEIVEFAGINQFLDTPVKHYSSGMYVRLAFSVAAHMDTDILIVDEVLAVGDAEFQKKCLSKMSEITKSEGRTILFVSHNMGTVKLLCKKCILLEDGKIKKYGQTEDVIENYIKSEGEKINKNTVLKFSSEEYKKVEISSIELMKNNEVLSTEDEFKIRLGININEKIESIFTTIIFFDQEGHRCVDFMEIDSEPNAISARNPGKYDVTVTIPPFFKPGTYSIMVVIEKGQETLDKREGFLIRVNDTRSRIYPIQGRAPINPKVSWVTNENTPKL